MPGSAPGRVPGARPTRNKGGIGTVLSSLDLLKDGAGVVISSFGGLGSSGHGSFDPPKDLF